MRKQSNATCLILLIVILSACSTETPASPSTTLTPAPASTLAATLTSTPVSISTLETPAPLSNDILSAIPDAAPTPFGGSGRILFVSCDYETVTVDGATFERTDGDSCEIYSMNSDGSERINLTNNDVWDGDPAPSPDGTKIAYVSNLENDNAEIIVMNSDGSGKSQLTDSRDWNSEPAWSPDGNQLVFVTLRRREFSEIKIMNVDGSGQTIIAESELASEGHYLSPNWSPLGTQIAYVREGFQGMECQGCSEIFVMNVDGSNPTQITHNSWSQNPVWSPDGTRIAYETYLRPRDIGILAINLNDSSSTELVNTEGWDAHPSWSPDGKAIAFLSDRGQSTIGEFDIYVIGTNGSGLKRLTANQNPSSPVWSRVPLHLLVQHSDCSSGWTRLKVGDQAMVSQTTTTPNRVRAGPGTTEAVVAQLHPGTVMKVIEGPVCADGLIFWRVENQAIPGGTGWTAEGDGAEYWMEPYVQ
jgi:Tol biopolymer transport system component